MRTRANVNEIPGAVRSLPFGQPQKSVADADSLAADPPNFSSSIFRPASLRLSTAPMFSRVEHPDWLGSFRLVSQAAMLLPSQVQQTSPASVPVPAWAPAEALALVPAQARVPEEVLPSSLPSAVPTARQPLQPVVHPETLFHILLLYGKASHKRRKFFDFRKLQMTQSESNQCQDRHNHADGRGHTTFLDPVADLFRCGSNTRLQIGSSNLQPNAFGFLQSNESRAFEKLFDGESRSLRPSRFSIGAG